MSECDNTAKGTPGNSLRKCIASIPFPQSPWTMLMLSTAKHLRPYILRSRPSTRRLFSSTIARDQIPAKPKFNERSSYTETEEPSTTWELGDGAVRFSSDVGVDGEKTVWDMIEVPTRYDS